MKRHQKKGNCVARKYTSFISTSELQHRLLTSALYQPQDSHFTAHSNSHKSSDLNIPSLCLHCGQLPKQHSPDHCLSPSWFVSAIKGSLTSPPCCLAGLAPQQWDLSISLGNWRQQCTVWKRSQQQNYFSCSSLEGWTKPLPASQEPLNWLSYNRSREGRLPIIGSTL